MAPPHGLAAIVDGQHRLGAAHVLDQRGDLHDGLAQILVEVYPPMGDASVRELFTEINKSEPVTLIDLPEDFGGASRDENQLLTAAAETLKARYPAMFKASQACRAPHLNVLVILRSRSCFCSSTAALLRERRAILVFVLDIVLLGLVLLLFGLTLLCRCHIPGMGRHDLLVVSCFNILLLLPHIFQLPLQLHLRLGWRCRRRCC